jgi:FdhE protein
VAPLDRNHLLQLAESKWAEILANSPDLAPAVGLQRTIVQLVLDATSRLDQTAIPVLGEDMVQRKWARGIPALRNEEIAVPDGLKEVLAPLCAALADGGAGEPAEHLRDALLTQGIDGDSLLRVSLARDQEAIRTSALHMGLSPDLVWLIGELGSSPLAYLIQERLLAEAGTPKRGSWDRGYCPSCGSWPTFIELVGDSRDLRCSFCAATWQLASHRCVYCGNAGSDFVTAAPDLMRSNRLVELCSACGNYTKALRVRDPARFPLLAIDDLATTDLDHAAMDRDYRRPPLIDLNQIEPLTRTCR